MSANESVAPERDDTGSSFARLWRGNELLPDITRRLTKSATIALLLSPIGIIFLAVIRLLMVCNYNVATALAIASSGGYVNTLFGTVLPMVPILLPYLALGLLILGRVIPGILALAATLLISPAAVGRSSLLRFLRRAVHDLTSSGWLIPILIVASLALLLLLIQLVGRGWTIFSRSLATIGCILLVPIVFVLYPFPSSNSYYAHLIRQPWLPAETITLKSGSVLTGYIVSDNEDWTTVLNDSNRMIYYYRPTQIIGRQVCQSAAVPTKPPIISLITTSLAGLPSCG